MEVEWKQYDTRSDWDIAEERLGVEVNEGSLLAFEKGT